MQAKFIDYGTKLEISVKENGKANGQAFTGSFYNTVGDFILLVEGDGFFKHCSETLPGFLMEAAFYARSLKYTFTAEYMDTTVINGVNLVRLQLKSPVEEASLRALARIDLSAAAKIYVTANTKKEYAFDALTIDITLDGVSLYSTVMLPPGETPEVYKVGLTLFRNSFLLPVKLLRSELAEDHGKFKTKFIFLMDFSATPEMKDKLMFALFEYKRSGL